MIHIGTEMVRKRVIEADEDRDARILEFRKNRMEKLLAETAANPKPRRSFIPNWWRVRRTITIA